jgi:hypothetical protein
MGAFVDTTRLVQKYPLTFLAISAAATLALPVLSVSTASALRPWAKRILKDALAVRREALRILAESTEAYADLRAEVEAEADACTPERPVVYPSVPGSPRLHQVDAAQAQSPVIPVA